MQLEPKWHLGQHSQYIIDLAVGGAQGLEAQRRLRRARQNTSDLVINILGSYCFVCVYVCECVCVCLYGIHVCVRHSCVCTADKQYLKNGKRRGGEK